MTLRSPPQNGYMKEKNYLDIGKLAQIILKPMILKKW